MSAADKLILIGLWLMTLSTLYFTFHRRTTAEVFRDFLEAQIDKGINAYLSEYFKTVLKAAREETDKNL